MSVIAIVAVVVFAVVVLALLAAIQGDTATIRKVAVSKRLEDSDETFAAYTRGVDDGRRLAREERER